MEVCAKCGIPTGVQENFFGDGEEVKICSCQEDESPYLISLDQALQILDVMGLSDVQIEYRGIPMSPATFLRDTFRLPHRTTELHQIQIRFESRSGRTKRGTFVDLIREFLGR